MTRRPIAATRIVACPQCGDDCYVTAQESTRGTYRFDFTRGAVDTSLCGCFLSRADEDECREIAMQQMLDGVPALEGAA